MTHLLLHRLAFVVLWSVLLSSVSSSSSSSLLSSSSSSIPPARPVPSARRFVSPVIDAYLSSLSSRMSDPDLATLFSNTFPNTLDTTIQAFDPSIPDTFIITGDIHAQWLRDSMNQVLPYIPFATQDQKLQTLLCGLIHRHARNIVHDPFANSFNYNASGEGHQDDQRTPKMTPDVFEGKYELDSLCAALKLAYQYFRATSDTACFFTDSVWRNSIDSIIATVQALQKKTAIQREDNVYLFQRTTQQASDTLYMNGVHAPGAFTGMSRTAFRGSDDAIVLPFNIPANAMLVVELRHLSEMLHAFINTTQPTDPTWPTITATTATALASEVDDAIQEWGIVAPRHLVKKYGPDYSVYAYEVDGYGSYILMDDANVPSLLSLPYLGYLSAADPVYQRTRALMLSENGNPYFFKGLAGEGIGGPHVGLGYIWPMAITMRALTSTQESEIVSCLSLLKASSAGTGFMHESFQQDHVTKFTRSWFAWANSLFGELIVQLSTTHPHLIFNNMHNVQAQAQA